MSRRGIGSKRNHYSLAKALRLGSNIWDMKQGEKATWSVTPRPLYPGHSARSISKWLDNCAMPKTRTPIAHLFPSKLRIRLSVYDPANNRYEDAHLGLPPVIVATQDEYNKIAQAIRDAIAQAQS